MKSKNTAQQHRRLLLKFLAGSPLIASAIPTYSDNSLWQYNQDPLISKASEAINVFDFQKVAQHKLPAAHYGYLSTGVLDDRTMLENEKAFQEFRLKIRQLVNMDDVDMSVDLFGSQYSSPLFICPCGSQKAFHPDGELAVARAAKNEDHLQLLSTVSTTSLEDVTATRGKPVWFQLYPSVDWQDTLTMIQRAEKAGSPAIVLTVDMNYADKRETLTKMMKLDTRKCQSCHNTAVYGSNSRKPMINSLKNPFRFNERLTWDYLKQIKESTNLKVLVKGIVSREDAVIAIEQGIDGIIVSNHGGRAGETGYASLFSLMEVAKVAKGKVPLMMDSGIRRGKDIFKALALGADAVGIGRPYLWGLSAFGQEGVEMVLKILKAELKLAMQQTGVKTVQEIGINHLT